MTEKPMAGCDECREWYYREDMIYLPAFDKVFCQSCVERAARCTHADPPKRCFVCCGEFT